MRLVLVTETFPPEVNGVARTLGRWLEAFRRRGHSVQVIRPRQLPERGTPNRVLGLRIPFYPELRFGLASPLRLSRTLARARPDLVHIATEGPLGLAALVAAGRLGVPVAASFHTNFDYYAAHYGLGPLKSVIVGYLRWFHNRAAVTLVPSASTCRRLDELGFCRVELWSRGVDSELFHPRCRDAELRSSLGLGPDDCLLLYAGRLAAEKNVIALLEAFTRLRARLEPDRCERVRLALVGDGPLAASLKVLSLPGVVLPGMQLGKELSRWYASADIFAFPSVSETFGNVVLEALASGLPVVAYDCPGVNEQIVHDKNGLLVSPGQDFVDALYCLVEQRDLRSRLALAARATAEARGWEPIFDGLEQLYRRILNPGTKGVAPVGQGEEALRHS
jgi:glycosyltransferase involved in cell wall biosynthesis